jgi:cephalosporin hydroxylase
MKLSNYYIPTVGDIGYGDMNTVHSYLDTYDELLAPYEDTKNNIVEIGVAYGHKIEMLKKFCKNATIIGFDVKLLVSSNSDRVKLYEIDATTTEAASKVSNLDIVIDDGSHNPNDQLASFKLFWPLLNTGGIYIIEDIADIAYVCTLFSNDAAISNIQFNIYDFRAIKNRYDDVLMVAYK